MRDYELVLVVDPDLTPEKQKKLIAQIKKIIEEFKGRVAKIDEWGKKELSYPIEKKNLGYYFLLTTQLPEKKISDFDRKLKLEKGILRYLLVRR